MCFHARMKGKTFPFKPGLIPLLRHIIHFQKVEGSVFNITVYLKEKTTPKVYTPAEDTFFSPFLFSSIIPVKTPFDPKE